MAADTSSLTGKIAVVTGGSRGLGQNTVLHLAKRGARVVFTYRSSREEADKVVAQVKDAGSEAVALALDAGDVESFDAFAGSVRKALQSFGAERFHFLVNNAGLAVAAKFEEATPENLDQHYDVQFKGVFFVTQKLLPLMEDGGRIVMLSTGLTRFVGPEYVAYACMKGAIEVLTHYLAKALGPRRIAVNTVAPGAIETDFGGGVVRDNKQMNQAIAGATALGRVGLPDDIGPMIAALLTEDNRWINAQRIEVSGGQMI